MPNTFAFGEHLHEPDQAAPMIKRQTRVGIDTGGTFTDFVAILVDGTVMRHKELSDRDDPSAPVELGLRALQKRGGWEAGTPLTIVHGTTIGVNAILQGKFAETALVVSLGFRDVLEIERQRVPDPFNLHAPLPQPLIPRNRVFELDVRIAADGSVLRGPTDEKLSRLCDEISADTKAIVVALINAHANPALESRVTCLLSEKIPAALVTASTTIWPEFREYERTMAAVVNAVIHPLMDEYLRRLSDRVNAVAPGSLLLVTTSSGGVVSLNTARQRPVETLLSGPASGTVAASILAKAFEVSEAVTFDMGGTSADIGILQDGEAERLSSTHIGEIPILLPAIGISSIGAGGGSILHVDSGGLLKIGPESAGSIPGPVAFDQGGERPTITDCYIATGIIDPNNFLGGRKKLNRAKAEVALTRIADDLGMSTAAHVAEAGLDIATARMATELLKLLAERGHDPSVQTIIPFGGAGPTHALKLADEAGLVGVLVPAAAATYCAYGAAVSELRRDWIRTIGNQYHRDPDAAIWGGWTDLEKQAVEWLDAENVPMLDYRYVHAADMQYSGQSHYMTIDVPTSVRESEDFSGVAEALHNSHELLYGFRESDDSVEVVSIRLSIIGRLTENTNVPDTVKKEKPSIVAIRPVFHAGEWIEASVYDRTDVNGTSEIAGPAIIEQSDSTTWVPPGWMCRLGKLSALVIKRINADVA